MKWKNIAKDCQDVALGDSDPTKHYPDHRMSDVAASLIKDVWTVPASISSLPNTFRNTF